MREMASDDERGKVQLYNMIATKCGMYDIVPRCILYNSIRDEVEDIRERKE